jgi:hypothetical protein
MTREVQVLAWCDVDMAEDRRVPMAATHEVVVDGKAYTVDLCEDHEAAVYKPFLALVAHGSAPAPKGAQNRAQRARAVLAPGATPAKVGRPVGDQARALPLGARCLVADCGTAYDGRTQGGLTQHMRAQHGLGLDALGRACPVCGEVKSPGTGLANHVSKAHHEVEGPALVGVLAAWWWASTHGDPEGAIAASGLLPFAPPLAPTATRVEVAP